VSFVRFPTINNCREVSLPAESTPVVLMIRHVTPARRKVSLYSIQELEIDRPMRVGGGPNPASDILPWMKLHHHGDKFPWLLFARFKGENWVQCLASNPRLAPVERVANNKKLQVLATWYDPTENRSHAQFYKRGALAADLVAVGTGDAPLEVVSFKSSAHPKSLLKGCKTVREAVVGFFAGVEAQAHDLQASGARDSFELHDSRGRAIDPDELADLAAYYYTAMTAAENPAATRLLPAIQNGDLEAARQAIADGASVEFLPDAQVSPLSILLDLPVVLAHACPENWRDFAKLLVEAGAPIDGYAWERPLICSVIQPLARTSQSALCECLQTILELGADINVLDRGMTWGATPLHLAVDRSFPEVVRFLIDRGANLDAGDGGGFTPLQCAERMARNDPDPPATEEAEVVDSGTGARGAMVSALKALANLVEGTPQEQARRRAQVIKLLRAAATGDKRG
jgi:hypothetical protein